MPERTLENLNATLTVEPGAPAIATVDGVGTIAEASGWLGAARTALRTVLNRHGAVLVRGLPIADEPGFARLRDILLPEPVAYREKATPRTDLGHGVLSSTDLPPAQPIRLHNENSYTLTFPGTLLFGCLSAPEAGGATPVADCRQVLRNLPDELVDRFRRSGWCLVRNYGEYISLDWRSALGATTRADAERYCDANLVSYRWTGDDGLRTEQRRSAVITHPHTGDEVWFNHAAFWSEWSLDDEIREELVDEMGPDGLPFNTKHGDGEPLTRQEADVLNAAYDAATVRTSWVRGDLLIVDNILAAHGREAFRGDRKIVVAMGQPVALADCRPTVAAGTKAVTN